MTQETQTTAVDSIGHAAEIVAAYVSNNSVRAADLPGLITSVHAAVTGLANGDSKVGSTELAIEKATPAQVRKSITHDGIVSFIDGRSYKTLKRHLTSHGLTPERYRERYGLPADYPMTSPSYSEMRSSLAKTIGLGVVGARATRAAAPSTGRSKAA